MTETFQTDLKVGKIYEQQVLNMIQKKYPLANIVEGYFKDWDIFIPELNIGVLFEMFLS